LGLAQDYSFAKQSNSHVDIDSELGRGTKVTLYLPRATGPVVPREPIDPRTHPSRR